MHRYRQAATDVMKDSVFLNWELLKIMLPVMIIVEAAIRFGFLSVISDICAPVMTFVGLPAETAIALATNLLVGIYGGAAAMIGIMGHTELTVADVTILSSMMLMAHALPVEQRIIQKIGCNLVMTTLFRLIIMIGYAWILNMVYSTTGMLQETAVIAWAGATDAGPQSWAAWAWDSAVSLFWLYWIVLALLSGLKIMELTGITALLTKLLAPGLRLFGIGPNAAPLAMVGVLLGLAFGAGLILREIEKGHLKPRSIFLSVCFMILCHSMIEDTLVALAIGGHWTGVLAGRILLTIVIMVPLGMAVHALPDRMFERWLYGRKFTAPDEARAPI